MDKRPFKHIIIHMVLVILVCFSTISSLKVQSDVQHDVGIASKNIQMQKHDHMKFSSNSNNKQMHDVDDSTKIDNILYDTAHFNTTGLQHMSLFYLNVHYAASSMSINYSQQITKLSKTFSPAADINQRILKVENQYLGHQTQVKILGNFTFSELNTEGVNCKNTSVDIIQALSYRTTQMRQYLQSNLNVNQINFISNQKQRESTKQGIQNQIIYLKGIQKYLQSGCSKNIKISNTFFVSNPNANNWILGQWTYDQFISSYVSTMNKQKKITKCPISNPFYDSTTNQCINCKYPNNIWDMKQRKCSACPYAQIVNLKTRKCVSQIHYVNNIMDQNHPWITKSKDLTSIYEQFNKQKVLQNSVVCPFDTPFILNEKCSFCGQNQVYVLEQRRCNAIPFHMQYDKNLHKVVQKLQKYQTNQAVSSNLQENLKKCPTKFPYFDGITCINCVFPNYFNQRRKSCEPCLNLDKCGPKKASYVTNSLASNVTAKNSQQVTKYFDSNAQKIKDVAVSQCPKQTPFYNQEERKCISCPQEKRLFNISTFKCVNCAKGSTFNQQTYLCQSLKGVKTSSKAPALLIQNIETYKQQQAKIQGPQCSSDLPYYDGMACISCESQQLFNTSSKQCTQCPQGTSYNNVQFKCNDMKYKTNSLADMIWVQNLTDYQDQYEKNTGKECPITQPFYNSKKCIKCLQEQIFNTSSLACSKCPADTTFDSVNKNCTSQKLKIFLPGKTDNLVGFPSYSADQYLKQFQQLKQNQTQKCSDNQNSKKTSCITCQKDTPYFNVKTLSCIACQKYDSEKKICYDNITYLTNTNKTDKFLSGKQGQVGQFVKDQQNKLKNSPDIYQVCPDDKPVIIKQTCQPCQDYYDVSLSQCVKCDNYNAEKKICEAKPYISNLKYGVPAYSAKNMTKVLEDYQQQKKNGIQICPFATPFYNGRQCIKCSQSDQYFNIDDKKCQNCSSTYKFNTIINQCQQDPPKYYTSLQSPNLIYDGQPVLYYKYKIDKAIQAGSKQCPKETPYYTMSNKCESCKQPDQYFNLLRRICTHCPQKSSYVQIDHQCETPIGDIVTPKATLQKSLANFFT